LAGATFEDEHEPHIVDVGEELRDGWAALDGLGFQPTLRRARSRLSRMALFRSQPRLGTSA
jgi:hypothetical protein